jgi:hypothetical protein
MDTTGIRGNAVKSGTSMSAPAVSGNTVRITIEPWPPFAGKDLPERGVLSQLTEAAFEAAGYTLVPVRLKLKNGKAKVDIGVAKGKKLHDKRQSIARRQIDRDCNEEPICKRF